jgi:hypothetical protein
MKKKIATLDLRKLRRKRADRAETRPDWFG